MSKQSELDRLWRKMQLLDREIISEGRVCAQRGSRTQRHATLSEDMRKLKAEYEKIKGGGEYNPMSLEHGETITRKTVMDGRFGKRGPDTHSKMED